MTLAQDRQRLDVLSHHCQSLDNAQRSVIQGVVDELERSHDLQASHYAQRHAALNAQIQRVQKMERNLYSLVEGRMFQMQQGFYTDFQECLSNSMQPGGGTGYECQFRSTSTTITG